MSQVTSLFLYKPLFVLELLSAVLVFSYRLKRKENFFLRSVVGVIFVSAVAWFFPVLGYDTVSISAMFLCLFAAAGLIVYFCYDEPIENTFFCSIAGYTTQHLASALYNLIVRATGLEGMQLFGYGNVVQSQGSNLGAVLVNIIYFDVFALTYWLVYLIWGSRLGKNEDLRLKRSSTLVLTGIIIVADVVLNAGAVAHSYQFEDNIYMMLNYTYNALCCLLILIMQFGLVSEKKLALEVDISHQLLAQQQQQYEIAKENIDRINIKCHDLKHQIHQIAQGSSLNAETAQEIENIISIYDSTVQTGNKALDIILTEKSLLCNENGIRITCLADGERLGFMKDAEIYTLFGNAVDNAIEAVMKIREVDKRVIGLKVVANGSFLSISLFNYFVGAIRMNGDFPATTKKDKEDHGFGIRSMQQIVDKYNGTMSFETEGEIFNLNIVFQI